MDLRIHVSSPENGIIELDQESEIISEETLAQLVNDDEHSWLSIDLISTNGVNHRSNGKPAGTNNHFSQNNDAGLYENGEGDDDNNHEQYDKVASEQQHNGKQDCDLNNWLTTVLDNEAYKSTKDNLVRELDNLAVLHKLESSSRSNKFGRVAMPERNLETRWESKLEYNKEAKLDTRTITKRKPTFFNRFLSSEELSPSNGNLRNTKLNYSSSNISGSNTNLNNHLGGSNNELESTFTMRKTKLNNTFTMDDEEKINPNESFTITRRDQIPQSSQQIIQQRDQQYLSNTATVTRGLNGVTNRKIEQDQPVKKKPISMYSVYAEPTDSRPIRSSNSNVLSAYRLFKSSALNRQYEYRDDELILNNTRYSPEYLSMTRKASTPITNNTVSTARMIKRNGTFTCNKPTLPPRIVGSFIPKPK